MLRHALAASAVALTSLVAVPSAALALPAGASYRNPKSTVSLLVSKSSSRGYVNGRTACGRLADRRVTIKGSRIRSSSSAKLRVSGTIGGTARARRITLKVRKGTCSRSYTLKRYSE